MEIKDVQDAINRLEQDITTPDNISELADPYIIQDNLRQGLNPVITELNDILPAYTQYLQDKREFQLGNVSENLVITGIKQVCRELFELICTIYKGTDMGIERHYISKLILDLHDKYVKSP